MGQRFDAIRDAINKSWVGRAVGWIGENVVPAFSASWRQGLKEVGQVLPAFPDSIRPVEELGTLGNPTQLEVNMEKGVQPSYGRSSYGEYLASHQSEVRESQDRGLER